MAQVSGKRRGNDSESEKSEGTTVKGSGCRVARKHGRRGALTHGMKHLKIRRVATAQIIDRLMGFDDGIGIPSYVNF